ncbi:MAG: hypothetical protein K0S33_281 [Bacteroidetes bacterium]|jgi:hypothetical protein|nr:hypothetical protein [Bacteroidota bacterium]
MLYFLHLVPELFICITCLLLLVKKRSAESILLFIGSGGWVLISLYNMFGVYLLPHSGSGGLMGLIDVYGPAYFVVNTIGQPVAWSLFSIGLFILVNKLIKNK